MKKIFGIFFCLLLITTVCFAQRKSGLTGRFVPADNKTLLFYGQNNNECEKFIKTNNNKVPAGFMIYTSLTNLEGLYENKNTEYEMSMSGNFILNNYKKAALQIGLYLGNSLEPIIDGYLDNNIKKLGKWIKKANVPVFLRIGYEFDSPENNYDPELYKQAFRYIVDKLDKQKIKNVAYVWHSVTLHKSIKTENWYPGDNYVDWCAVSYFENRTYCFMINFCKEHNKPLMIAECSTSLGTYTTDANKIKWYKILFNFIQNKNVKALCYLNVNFDKMPMFESYSLGNGKLDASENIKNFWFENIKDARFINLDKLYKELKRYYYIN